VVLNHPECTRLLLLAGASLELQVAGTMTVLGAAAGSGSPCCVQLLIAAGADVHYVSPAGATALHYAATQGETAVIAQLLDAGADINHVDKIDEELGYGRVTALICTALHSKHEAAQLLIERGADLNAVSAMNMTALACAAELGDAVMGYKVAQRWRRRGPYGRPHLCWL
jgi:uncharacterized protein